MQGVTTSTHGAAAPGAQPTLDEVLDLAPRGSFQFNIETKIFPNHPELTPSPDRFAALLLDVVRRHGLESRVVVQSFDYRTLVAMRKLAPRIRLSALCSGTVQDPAVIARAAGGAQILSPEHSTVTPETVRSAHASGLQVVPWTANTPADWERMIAAGADAIITDDPAGLIAYLKQKNLR